MRKGILCVLCVEQTVSKSSLKLPMPTVFTSTTETSAVGQLSSFKSSPSMGRCDCDILWVGTNANNRTDKVKIKIYRRVFLSLFPWQFLILLKIGGNAQDRKLKIHLYFVLLQCTLCWSANELINTWYEEKQNKLILSNMQLEKKQDSISI